MCFSTLYESLSTDNKLIFAKLQLDKGFKDKKHLSEDFHVEFYFLLPKQVREMLSEGGSFICLRSVTVFLESMGVPVGPVRPGAPPPNFDKLSGAFRNTSRLNLVLFSFYTG